MNFLKTLFWMALTVVAVVFAMKNWTVVQLNLWAGLQADAKLPVLLLIAFLLGFVPTWLWARARLWQARRRVEIVPRAVATPAVPTEPPASLPVDAFPPPSTPAV